MLYQKCQKGNQVCVKQDDRNLTEDFTAGIAGTAEVQSILHRQ